MVCILLSILIVTVSLALTAWVVPGVRVRDRSVLLAAGLTLWVLRLVAAKILAFLSVPLCPWDFGFGSLVLHMVLLRSTKKLVQGFELRGFGSTLLAALFMMALVQMLSWLLL